MEIKFTDSFFKSFKKMINQERWYWKTWDFFRYDLNNGIRNIFFFWKVIWNFRSWDYTFQMRLLSRSLEPLADQLTKGTEVEVTRLKKLAKIKRVIEILNHQSDCDYIELAEKTLKYEVDSSFMFSTEPDDIAELNKAIFHLSDELEKSEWAELWTLLQGQDHSEYCKLVEEDKLQEIHNDDLWSEWYDGSGLNHWWD